MFFKNNFNVQFSTQIIKYEDRIKIFSNMRGLKILLPLLGMLRISQDVLKLESERYTKNKEYMGSRNRESNESSKSRDIPKRQQFGIEGIPFFFFLNVDQIIILPIEYKNLFHYHLLN